jgi:hypothetical protein
MKQYKTIKTHIKIILILLSISSFVSSQNDIKTDTIKLPDYLIIINVPLKSHSHYDRYEEGFFRTITCIDTTIITIHCGAMVNLPLIDLTKNTITSKFILGKDVSVLRGYCDSLNNGVKRKKYFREENYFKFGITVMYENVDEFKLIYYDSILNNVKIIKIEKKQELY